MNQYKGAFILSLCVHVVVVALILLLSYRWFRSVPARIPAVEVHVLQPRPTSSVSSLSWLKKRFKQHFIIDRRFAAADGLTGFVVHLPDDPDDQSIVYTDQAAHYAMIGTLIDAKKGNLSLQDSERYIQPQQYHAIDQAASHLDGLLQGARHRPILTIVIDPNSNLFPAIYKNLETDVAEKLFSINWLLLDYLKPNGPNVAAAILQSPHPLTGLRYSANHYNVLSQTAGYQREVKLMPATRSMLRRHWNFVQRFHLYQLPVSIVKANHQVHVIHGFIMDELLEHFFAHAPANTIKSKLR